MFSVFVRGIEFYGYHGVPAEERVVGHRYRVDVTMKVEGQADHSDDVSDTVDYGAVAQRVTEIGQTEKAHTVERLARLIGERILAEYPLAIHVKVSVVKPFPPAPVIASEAGAEVELEAAKPVRNA